MAHQDFFCSFFSPFLDFWGPQIHFESIFRSSMCFKRSQDDDGKDPFLHLCFLPLCLIKILAIETEVFKGAKNLPLWRFLVLFSKCIIAEKSHGP